MMNFGGEKTEDELALEKALSSGAQPSDQEALDAALAQSGPRYSKAESNPKRRLSDLNEDDQIKYLGFDPDTVKRSKRYKPGVFSAMLSAPVGKGLHVETESPDTGKAQIGALIHGGRKPFEAIQEGLRWVGEKTGARDESELAVDRLYDAIQEHRYQSTTGKQPLTSAPEFLGSAAAGPQGLKPATRMSQLGTHGIAEIGASPIAGAASKTAMALQGAGYAALQPTGESSDEYAGSKLKQLLMGAGMGVGTGKAVEKLFGNPASKMLNTSRNELDPEAAAIMRDAGSAQLKPSTIRSAMVKPEREISQTMSRVEDLKNRLSAEADKVQFKNIDEVWSLASSDKPGNGLAKEVLKLWTESGGDKSDVMRTSMGLQSITEKARMKRLDAKVTELMKNVKSFRPSEAIQTIDDNIAMVKSGRWRVKDIDGAVKELESLKMYISGTPASTVSPYHSQSGEGPVVIRGGNSFPKPETVYNASAPVGAAPELGMAGGVTKYNSNRQPTLSNGSSGSARTEPGFDYDMIPTTAEPPVYGTPGSNPRFSNGAAPEQFPADFGLLNAKTTLQQLGKEISGSYKGENRITGDIDAKVLQAIKEAMERDMYRAAKSSGVKGLESAMRISNTEYSKYAGTFKDPTIIKALTSNKTDEIMEAFRKTGEDGGQKLYSALDPKGKAAWKSLLMDSAASKMTNMGKLDASGLAKAIQSQAKTFGVVLNEAEKLELGGIEKTLQHLANLPDSSPLARQLSHAIPGKMGYAARFIQAVRDKSLDVFDSDAGRRFLFASKALKPGTSKMDNLIQSFLDVSARKGADMGMTKYKPGVDVESWIKSQGDQND